MDIDVEDSSFTTIDYGIFAFLLVVSSAIGFYYGFVAKRKQNNTEEYLLGGKEMGLLPISISLIVSHISGITMLGIPTEIYAYGTQYWLSFIAAFAIPLGLLYVFYPVFYELQLVSTFTYLEKRFSRIVRLVASFCFLLGSLVFLPIFIYVPSLAFNQVSGINIHIVTAIATGLCVFYTTFGGLRAVVSTDVVQFIIMIGSVFVVIVVGLWNLEEPLELLNIADRGQRLVLFDVDPSPFPRQTVWTILFGMSVFWCSGLGCSQSCIQKLLAVPDKETAHKAIWIFTVGVILFNFTAILTGLVMYANLENCDPFTAGLVRKMDQVLPYFITMIGSKVTGLSGIFVAGLFSAGLSSMSGLMNTMSCTIYEDFLKNRMRNVSEQAASNILKLIVLLIGLIALSLIVVIDRLGTIFELTLSLGSVTGGAIFGLFTSGMLCRYMNTKGAICGAIVSVLLMTTITIGAQSLTNPQMLPMKTTACGSPTYKTMNTSIYESDLPEHLVNLEGMNVVIHTLNETEDINQPMHSNEDVFWLFRISYMYYTLIGCSTVWLVGLPISLLTGRPQFEEDLLAPFLRRDRHYL